MDDIGRYLFSAVRVVPNPAAGEFVNIAAIAGSDETGEWAVRILPDERRARQFCGAAAIAAAHDTIARIGYLVDLSAWLRDIEYEQGDEPKDDVAAALKVGEEWLGRLHLENHRAVQFSAPAPVLAASVEDALDLVFPRVTVQPTRRPSRLTKWRLISSLGQSYLEAGLEPEDLKRNVTLLAQGPRLFTHGIDFAVSNGRVLQLAQTWSFRVASQDALARDVKAWGWTMKELREHGGLVRTRKRSLEVAPAVEMQTIIAPPAPGQPNGVYEEALGVFEELGVTVHPHGEEEIVAAAAAELVAKATGRSFS